MQDKLVTVLGGSGFVGRYVVQALVKAGARVRVASRDAKHGWAAKSGAVPGQIQLVGADVSHPVSLAAACAGADVVINLVGSFDHMEAVQAIGAGNVAAAAKAAGAMAFVHLSAIGADVASPALYGRTKGEGEAAVLAAFPSATILRPSIIFGREDQFVNRFAGMIAALPILPVIRGAAKFQPVFVGDVARAVLAAAADPESHGGKTYELGGPEVLSMAELNAKIAVLAGRDPLMLDVPDALASLMAYLPGSPMSRDQWKMLQQDNVVAPGAAGLAALGVAATSLEAVAPGWLVVYRKHGRFGAAA